MTQEQGYAPASPRVRRVILISIAGVHLVILLLAYLGYIALVPPGGRSRPRDAGIATFSFTAPEAPSRAQAAAQSGSGSRVALGRKPSDARHKSLSGTGSAGADTGAGTWLASAIAQAVADDPAGGGAPARYRDILRNHILAHRQYPTRGKGRRDTATVIVRFRVDRQGRIIDARVLRSQEAVMDQAAIATLWHAEPMPPVPDALAAPLEIEMPIDFPPRRTRLGNAG